MCNRLRMLRVGRYAPGPDAVLMLARRQRRLCNIKTMLAQHIVLARNKKSYPIKLETLNQY